MTTSRAAAFRMGFITNVFNPKTALFFLAFLPQFVRPSAGAVVPQILALGVCYLILSFITDGAGFAACFFEGTIVSPPRVTSEGSSRLSATRGAGRAT